MVSVFDGISMIDKKKLLKDLEANSMFFDKDVSLLSTVGYTNYIGILNDGGAQIIRTDYNGNKIIIEKLNTGSIFGIRFSLLNNDEYDIITTEKSYFTFVDFDLIKINKKKNNYYQKFIINLLDILSNMVFLKNERINILTRKTTREKLLEYFQNEAKRTFSKEFYLPFNLTELAEYLSIDRSAMMREIRHLKNDKIIESAGNKIKMLN